jgi:aryl-alcohol dehydrogenase
MPITGRGADYIIELTGHPPMLATATEAIRQLGTVALIAGTVPGTKASIDMRTLMNGRTLRGVIQGDSISKLFIPRLVDHYRAGRFPFERLVRFYEFDDIDAAFEDSRNGTTIRPVLRIGQAQPPASPA